ncbi:hypothetical protein [Cellulomonas pakistanensis]|uniref:Cupin 2 conserved barrel domain-containing protein n=1 Tax=Cellulomonas pakistanensis TaxID=992287 RepID=A0A919P889_9CELL|nr:hypothetical protein [Cellulomonas pakistanensis]GIG34696.1 hypothetical protein Cpa01nite_00770 [Cellulomonas pakistanensis]
MPSRGGGGGCLLGRCAAVRAAVGTRDGRVVEALPGQTVWCPPGEEHWHGAGPDVFMEHLAMWETTDARDGSETTWAEPVTDAQYGRS